MISNFLRSDERILTRIPKEQSAVTSTNSKHLTEVHLERSCECFEVLYKQHNPSLLTECRGR